MVDNLILSGSGKQLCPSLGNPIIEDVQVTPEWHTATFYLLERASLVEVDLDLQTQVARNFLNLV